MTKNRRVILFDIDYTLYNTQGFREFLADKLEEDFNVASEKWLEVYEKHKATLKNRSDFRPDKFLQLISQETGIPYTKLRKYYYKDTIHKAVIFEEVEEILEKLSKGYKLGIFSEGFKRYQKQKLKKGKIDQHFDPDFLFIHRRKLRPSALKTLPEGSLVIDDKAEVVEVINKLPNKVEAIWLNRINKDKHPHAKTIHTLNEILPLIDELT